MSETQADGATAYPRTMPLPVVAPGTRRVAVLGAGSWGTTFAKILADGGSSVSIWARRPELAREITQSRRNSDYLPGVNLPRGMWSSSRLPDVLEGADQVYLSVPSQSLRENLRIVRELIPEGVPVVSLMKGVERSTRQRMSEVIQQELEISPDRIAVVSGPNLALEIAKEQPTAAVVSSTSLATATEVAKAATNRYFRSFVNTDVIGTEFGGVLKNLIAVAIGIVDGVGYGENTKASIITRGLVEMTDFAVAFGARPETLAGLAGLGGFEETVTIEIDGETIPGVAEEDVDRTNAAGKASSVQFLHFPFTDAQIAAFRQQGAEVTLAVGHAKYRHAAVLPEAVRATLAEDFD